MRVWECSIAGSAPKDVWHSFCPSTIWIRSESKDRAAPERAVRIPHIPAVHGRTIEAAIGPEDYPGGVPAIRSASKSVQDSLVPEAAALICHLENNAIVVSAVDKGRAVQIAVAVKGDCTFWLSSAGTGVSVEGMNQPCHPEDRLRLKMVPASCTSRYVASP